MNTEFDFKGSTILIAEDEEDNYLLLEAFLEATGAEILHARNGEELLTMVENNNNIDLILMDIKMPGINGMEATTKIKEAHPDMPVIAQTAYAMQNEKTEILKAGCDSILTKPLIESTVLNTISKYL